MCLLDPKTELKALNCVAGSGRRRVHNQKSWKWSFPAIEFIVETAGELLSHLRCMHAGIHIYVLFTLTHCHLVVFEGSLVVHTRLCDDHGVAVPLLVLPQSHVLLTSEKDTRKQRQLTENKTWTIADDWNKLLEQTWQLLQSKTRRLKGN